MIIAGIIAGFLRVKGFMKRRSFLISAGIIAAFTSIPFIRRLSPPKPLVMHDAYSLWYNLPAIVEVPGGFCFGYVTPGGQVCVAEINDQLLIGKVAHLHAYESPSDHGAPSLLKVPAGKYAGRILACFSRHASPLFCTRTVHPESNAVWETSRMIDGGKSTYVSLAPLPDGKIVLMHTLQEQIGTELAGEWRRVVARTTDDGGDTWSAPVNIADLGGGTYPYSTPLAVADDGRCAMTYAIYRLEENRHQGLTLVITNDAFQTKVELTVELGDESIIDTIPYETLWLTESLVAVSYSQVTAGYTQGVSKLVTIDIKTGEVISNLIVSEVAVHTYAGGAAIAEAGRAAIYSPVTGGLVQQNIETGQVKTLVEEGGFSSPKVFNLDGKSMLTALKSPSIKSTRKFSAELFIMQLP